ncbi:MAG: hypothetical protein AAGD35_10595, partial [Actinomycetota bacterium]
MSERTEAELRRILASASITVADGVAAARARAGADPVPVPDRPPMVMPADEGRPLLADRVLWHRRWDEPALVALRNTLGHRRLHAVEPAPCLGTARLFQWLLGPWWRRRLGHDFNRDLPMELRRAGFQIFAIDRFRT